MRSGPFATAKLAAFRFVGGPKPIKGYWAKTQADSPSAAGLLGSVQRVDTGASKR